VSIEVKNMRARWTSGPQICGRLAFREAVEGYLFISPWVIGFLAFTAGPMLASLYFSFNDYNMVRFRWVGLDNYIGLFNDQDFGISLYNTVYYTVFSVPLRLLFALLVAVLLNVKVRGVSALRTAYYLPSITPSVAASVLWIWIFNPQYGLINSLLGTLGLPTPGWLGDPAWAKPAFVLMSLWGIGGPMVIFLAGLQSIPDELYEAAFVDGANTWHQLWAITLPMLSPTIFFIMGMIGAFQYFTIPYVLTGGDGKPAQSLMFYSMYIYRRAFVMLEMGYASALAWILFIIVLVCTLYIFRSSDRWVFYAGR